VRCILTYKTQDQFLLNGKGDLSISLRYVYSQGKTLELQIYIDMFKFNMTFLLVTHHGKRNDAKRSLESFGPS